MTSLLWPRPLPVGGTIGLCSPSGPSSPHALEKAVAALERRGYRVKVAPNTAARHPDCDYLAGTEAQRADDLNALLNDPEIDLILAARGGYGAGKLLDRLDYAALRANPRPLVGYSDITALNLALAAQAGVVSFSGIMATAGDGFGEESLHPFSEAGFFQATATRPPLVLRDDTGGWAVHRGKASLAGPLYPVCLTLLESLIATPYVPDLTGAVLVIEDVHEELYALDRALNQLRLAGVLERLTGLLLGSFNGWDDDKNAQITAGVTRLALEMTPDSVTVASGIPYGHIPRRFTLPVGAWAELDLAAGTIIAVG